MSTVKKEQIKQRRKNRVRAKIFGTALRPRLSVFRSITGMYLQIIDDEKGKTLASANMKNDAKTGDVGERSGKIAQAYLMGLAIAKKAKEKNIETVVFDRGGNLYHGRIKAAAEGARDGGLKF